MAEASVDYTKHVDLVFEGGGVKGIGLAGAVETLEQHGYKPQNVAGTSAGAISASLLAAGYSAEELKEIIIGLDYRQFQDKALGGQGAADRALAEHPPRSRPLRGRALPRVDPRAPRGQGRAHVRRPRPPRVRRRSQVPLAAPGGRVRRDDARAARAPARREEARDRAGRPRGRPRRADEHEHPDLLRARPAREPGDRRHAHHRRRRDALELPGLALRLRGRAAGLADLRDAARRAEAVGVRRGAAAGAQAAQARPRRPRRSSTTSSRSPRR